MNLREHDLTLLAEEAGEVAAASLILAKAAHKSLRFDAAEPRPFGALFVDLFSEINDLIAAYETATGKSVDISILLDRYSIEAKKKKVSKYLEISRSSGNVQGEL